VQTRHVRRHVGLIEQARKIKSASLPVLYAFLCVEQVSTTNQFVKRAHAELRHELARLFSHKKEIINHMLGLAAEFLAQHRVLRGHTNRAGVEVTLAHHDAAFNHQWGSRKTKFISTQQRANHHVAAGFHLAIGLHANAASEPVQNQRLLGFGQANFPWAPRVLDR